MGQVLRPLRHIMMGKTGIKSPSGSNIKAFDKSTALGKPEGSRPVIFQTRNNITEFQVVPLGRHGTWTLETGSKKGHRHSCSDARQLPPKGLSMTGLEHEVGNGKKAQTKTRYHATRLVPLDTR